MAIDFFVDFLFLVDILLNMCTSYYNEDYEMVLDRRQIIRHYARFWLWIDGLAFFPFEVPFLILQSSGTLTEASFPTGVFGMLKLPRLFRLARVFKKLDVVAAGNWFRILGIMIFFSLIAHWVACMCALDRRTIPRAAVDTSLQGGEGRGGRAVYMHGRYKYAWGRASL